METDGKYLFFCRYTPGRKNDVYWVDAASIPALRAATNQRENTKRKHLTGMVIGNKRGIVKPNLSWAALVAGEPTARLLN